MVSLYVEETELIHKLQTCTYLLEAFSNTDEPYGDCMLSISVPITKSTITLLH